MTKPEETANASRLRQPTEGSERGRKRQPQQRQRQPVGNTRGDSDSDSGDERNRGKGDFDRFCSTTRYNIYIWTLGASGVGSRSECKKSSEKRRVILDARAGNSTIATGLRQEKAGFRKGGGVFVALRCGFGRPACSERDIVSFSGVSRWMPRRVELVVVPICGS